MQQIETLQIIYQAVRERLDIQINSIENLDTKAGVFIGFNGLILSVILTLYPNVIYILFSFGIGLIIISILLAVIAYRTQLFRRDPEPRPLRELYTKEPSMKVISTLVDNLIDSFEENQKKLAQKSRLLNWSFFLTIVGLLILTLSTILRRS